MIREWEERRGESRHLEDLSPLKLPPTNSLMPETTQSFVPGRRKEMNDWVLRAILVLAQSQQIYNTSSHFLLMSSSEIKRFNSPFYRWEHESWDSLRNTSKVTKLTRSRTTTQMILQSPVVPLYVPYPSSLTPYLLVSMPSTLKRITLFHLTLFIHSKRIYLLSTLLDSFTQQVFIESDHVPGIMLGYLSKWLRCDPYALVG